MTRLRWKLWAAHAALVWEQLWPALVPPLCVIGLYMLAALTGLAEALPRAGQVVMLAVFAAGFIWSLKGFLHLRRPGNDEALRRLELAAGLKHRPASSYFDTLDDDLSADPASKGLWEAHRLRLMAALAKLRPGWPSPGMAKRDPYALRAGLLVAVLAALALSGAQAPTLLENAVTLKSSRAASQLWLDAWVTPPSYTGKAPLFLTRANGKLGDTAAAGEAEPAATGDQAGSFKIPAGSELTIRIAGGDSPAVSLTAADGKAMPVDISKAGEQTAGDATPAPRPSKSAGQAMAEWHIKLKASGTALVTDGGSELKNWAFEVIPDNPPEIDFADAPGLSQKDALVFTFAASDDYGIATARAKIRLAKKPDGKDDENAVPGLPIEPPDFALTLPQLKPRTVEQRVYQDLTAHPWAGLPVDLTLTATDEAGQAAQSGTVTFKLPERTFQKPLARALIEQRRNLITDPGHPLDVALALDALTLFPDRFIKDSAVHLGIRTVYYSLTRSPGQDELMAAVETLWDIALDIEEGDLSQAERDLRAAQKALMKALAEGASEDEISQAMDKLKQALNRYMQALAKQAEDAIRRGDMQPIDPNTQTMRPQDLAKMLDTIEKLARDGARGAAQQMLSRLQDILENMRAGMQMPQGRQQSQMSGALKELGGLIGKQQQLMDQTFRSENGAGQKGEQGMSGKEGSNLAQQQESLRNMLDRMIEDMKRNGVNAPQALGRAGEAMGKAEGSLREGKGRSATGQQGEAIDQLRQGAQALAREMMDGMAQRPGRNNGGQTGRAGQTDPLGRPTRTNGPDFGVSTKVPDEFAIEHAREIMRELQKRLGERFRPSIELDYLERLLRRF